MTTKKRVEKRVKRVRKWRAWAGLNNGHIRWEELPDGLAPCPSLYRTKSEAIDEGLYKVVVPVEIREVRR